MNKQLNTASVHPALTFEREAQLRDSLKHADLLLRNLLHHAQRRFLEGATVTDVMADLDYTPLLIRRGLEWVDEDTRVGDVQAALLTLNTTDAREVH